MSGRTHPRHGPMTGHSVGTQEIDKSQLRELVFRKTRFTKMRVIPCDPSKQFIHSFIQQIFIKCHYVLGTGETAGIDMCGL